MKTGQSRPRFFGSYNLLILPLLILVACQPAPDLNTAAFATAEISVIPTAAIAPISTEKTVALTVTSTSIATSIPSTATSIPSPVPTLSLAEKEAIASELYNTNANCKLPCWWGIVPGETEWQSVKSFFSNIATEITTSAESEADTYYSASVYLPVPQELSSGGELVQYYTVNEGKVEIIDSQAPRATSKIYTIFEILNTYGLPTEVKIDTYGSAQEGPTPFRLALFYLDKDILVRYGTNADFIDEYVVGCFQAGTGSVVVWSSELDLSFAEALNGTRGLGMFGEQYYKPLEEATDMDIEAFYQTYLDPDTDTCIETPAELWMDR